MVIPTCNPSRWCRPGNHHEFKVSLGYSLSLDFKDKQRKHCIRCFPHCCNKVSGRNQFAEERLSLPVGSEGAGAHGVEGMAPREVQLKWRQLGTSASQLGGSRSQEQTGTGLSYENFKIQPPSATHFVWGSHISWRFHNLPNSAISWGLGVQTNEPTGGTCYIQVLTGHEKDPLAKTLQWSIFIIFRVLVHSGNGSLKTLKLLRYLLYPKNIEPWAIF